MREIKFRAWHEPSGRMLKDATFDLGRLIGNRDYTVMQFTGLKDKNGKEIYEEDIVQIDINMGTSYRHLKGIVIFNGDTYTFENLNPSKKIIIDRTAHAYDSFNLGRFGEINIEVIGNKFENPELLKC